MRGRVVEGVLDDRLVRALSSNMRCLRDSTSEDAVLGQLVRSAMEGISDVEYAGVSLLRSDGGITSHAPGDGDLRSVDQLQATLREGPCVTALRGEGTVWVEDLDAELARWPRFVPEASASGVASMVSLRLFADRGTFGALNLYSGVRSGFSAESRAVVELFAVHAATVLAGARHVSQLRQALSSRDMIGQAKGILMERFGLNAEEAFSRLVNSSQQTNIKLVEVARWLAGRTDVPPE